jgi:hypothetical protein
MSIFKLKRFSEKRWSAVYNRPDEEEFCKLPLDTNQEAADRGARLLKDQLITRGQNYMMVLNIT